MELIPLPLVAAGIGWVIAQGLKYFFVSDKEKLDRPLRLAYMSGGMPSAHSATVVALATSIGMIDGFASTTFSIATVLALVVMYDAVMVRRSSGKQGAIISQILVDMKSKIIAPRFAKGHEPLEVLAGATIGVIVGIVVILATI